VIYVDGEPFRPDGPPATAADLREELLRRHQVRNRERGQGNQ